MLKIHRLPMMRTGEMGYLLGGYSTDRQTIFITGSLSMVSSEEEFKKIRQTSNGIIDYVGNVCVESSINGLPLNSVVQKIEAMVIDEECDTRNPIIASINKIGSVEFYMYDRGHLSLFSKKDETKI